jgi:hypothetical protein
MNQPEYSPDLRVDSEDELSLQLCPEPEQASDRADGELDNDVASRDETHAGVADIADELDGLRADLALMFDMPPTALEKSDDKASLDDRFSSFVSGGDVPADDASSKTADDGETGTEENEPTATDSDDATTAYMVELLARNRNRSNVETSTNEDTTPEPVPRDGSAADRTRVRAAPRHRVDRRLLESATLDSRLAVEIRRSESGETLSDSRLADISLSGAQFSLSSPVTAGERISVVFRCDESESLIETDAQVRWALLGRDYRWAAGVQFDQPLTNDTLRGLATSGLIDRRSSVRSDVTIRGTVKKEGRPDLIPVRLRDLSTQGFRLTSSENLEPGERILLQLQKREGSDGDFSCPAHVRWVASQDDGLTAGCEFVNADLAADIASLLACPSAPPRSQIRVSTIVITLLTFVALWVHQDSVFERLAPVWKSGEKFLQTAGRL